MPERKRKERDGTVTRHSKGKPSSSSSRNKKIKFRNGKKKAKAGGGHAGRGERRGPRLPSALRKELDRLNPSGNNNEGDEDVGSDEDDQGKDVYEYEDGVPEEESRKNRRFDTVENYEYELPDDFKVVHPFFSFWFLLLAYFVLPFL
uniref:Uncharacterized protein C57A7.06-like n=1 Tax=Rhizophora mucronata TaxID=61149 RepID=A0A2P2MUZ2_RHIMU